METFKDRRRHVPAGIRRPIVMIVGSLFILAAGLTGWLPGPGGIPLFLVGIAILATEFSWAKAVQDWVVGQVERLGRLWRRHQIIGTLLIAGGIAAGVGIAWYAYSHL